MACLWQKTVESERCLFMMSYLGNLIECEFVDAYALDWRYNDVGDWRVAFIVVGSVVVVFVLVLVRDLVHVFLIMVIVIVAVIILVDYVARWCFCRILFSLFIILNLEYPAMLKMWENLHK